MAEGNKYRVGQENFFRIAEALRTHREEIQNKCRRNKEVIGFLTEKLGFPVPESTIASVYNVTGIKFDFAPTRTKDSASDNRRIILNEIVRLYEKLGEKNSTDFLNLFERCFGRPYRAPEPVAKLTNVREIKVVNDPRNKP